jgi:hypothetical protein
MTGGPGNHGGPEHGVRLYDAEDPPRQAAYHETDERRFDLFVQRAHKRGQMGEPREPDRPDRPMFAWSAASPFAPARALNRCLTLPAGGNPRHSKNR